MKPLTLHKITLQLLILLGFIFGALNWSLRPEAAAVWLTGMLTLPTAWALVMLSGALPGSDKPQARRHIYNSLVGAGLLVTGTLAVVATAALGAIPDVWSARFGMISSALVLIVIGNALPKKIEPGRPRNRALAIQRLLGWTFVITGLMALGVWLVVPMALAKAAGLIVYGGAALFCVVAVLQVRCRAEPG